MRLNKCSTCVMIMGPSEVPITYHVYPSYPPLLTHHTRIQEPLLDKAKGWGTYGAVR